MGTVRSDGWTEVGGKSAGRLPDDRARRRLEAMRPEQGTGSWAKARPATQALLGLWLALASACGDGVTPGGDAQTDDRTGPADVDGPSTDDSGEPSDVPDASESGDDVVPGSCGDGSCETGEDCAVCPADCGACGACPDGTCGAGEDCTSCPADCGSCPVDCGGTTCPAGWRCAEGSGTVGPFCTTCDPAACAVFGVRCCLHNAAAGACTNTQSDANHCGGCGVICGPDQFCVRGVCQAAETLGPCGFDTMQWWRSPVARDQRDITFVAFADPHAADPSLACAHDDDYDGGDPDLDGIPTEPNQNEQMRDALNSVVPSVFWATHVWPTGAGFFHEGEAFDHVRGVVVAGDLTHMGNESLPSGVAVCREYRYYRDAYGRCGDEGRLSFPVYDGYGNHDFPRAPFPGDVNVHPMIDLLDRITAAHRPGPASDLYDDPTPGTGHYAWLWDDIWFVHVNAKPGYNNEALEDPSPHTMRIVDPHGARGFLRTFLLSLPDDPARQLVIVAHYPLNGGRIDPEEKTSFCRLIYNAQHGSGDFTGPKLSPSNPVVAYIHGHNHHIPEPSVYDCAAPYETISIPHFSAGTPRHRSPTNGNNLQFTIFRLGTNQLEAVGISAPADDPTGPWGIVFTRRLDILRAP